MLVSIPPAAPYPIMQSVDRLMEGYKIVPPPPPPTQSIRSPNCPQSRCPTKQETIRQTDQFTHTSF